MSLPEDDIDRMVVHWGERLFPDPLRHAQASRLGKGLLQKDALHMRKRIARTLGKAPEVIVRIASKASEAQGMRALSRHLRYISRDGALGLEDQDGQVITGRDALHDLVDLWRFAGWGIPERSRHRETVSLTLSMPPGTDREAVHDAARAFAAGEFSDGRLYVLAMHDDEPHPHVHLCIQARGPAARLGFSPQDCLRLRQQFARLLCERDVSANATPRRVRGETRRGHSYAITQMLARGEVPRDWRTVADAAEQRRRWEVHGQTLVAWHELARVLAQSAWADDRHMAMDIVDFVRTMPVVRERQQVEPDRVAGATDARLKGAVVPVAEPALKPLRAPSGQPRSKSVQVSCDRPAGAVPPHGPDIGPER